MFKRLIPALAMLRLASASSAFAASGYVEIRNFSQHIACFAKTTSFYHEGEGNGSITTGWDCVAPRHSFRFDIDRNEYVYATAIDETGADFLANRLNNYDQLTTWAPATGFDTFGVKTEARIDGTFSDSYFLGDAVWSADETVADRDALATAMGEHGFRQLTGRVFRGADVVGGLAVVIGF
jgi:hypothetical protein